MDIYIKANKKAEIYQKESVCIEDIADVFAPNNIIDQLNKLKICEIGDTKHEGKYLVTILDVIKKIDESLPGNTISSVGEMDVLINYSPERKNTNKIWLWTKISFVFLVLLAGSSTAIMSFHTDAQIAQVFKNYYYIFFNETIDNPYLIDIPYAIGIATGIMVFYNHFSKAKITNDPTPIEVEMASYETEVTDCDIDTLNNKILKKKERQKGASK